MGFYFSRAVTEATAAAPEEGAGPGAMNFHDFSGLVPVASTAVAVHSSLTIF